MKELSPGELAVAQSRAVRAKIRAEERSTRRTKAIVMLLVGIPFACAALGCFAMGVDGLVNDGDLGHILGPGVFGLICAVSGGVLLKLGVSYAREHFREDRLRTVGIAARGVIVAFRESSLSGKVDERQSFELTLQIDVEGRPPYNVVVSEHPPMTFTAVQGMGLPLLVDPANPQVLMVDWNAA